MKNAFDGLFFQNEMQKKKEQNSQDLWGNPKMCNIAQLENQKKKQQRAEKTKQTNKKK